MHRIPLSPFLCFCWHTNGNLKAGVSLTNGVVVTQEFFDESGKATTGSGKNQDRAPERPPTLRRAARLCRRPAAADSGLKQG